jgi:hypothetical protein
VLVELRLKVHPAVVVVLAAHTLPVHGDSGDCWRLNDDIKDGSCRQWLRLHLMDGTAQLGERRGGRGCSVGWRNWRLWSHPPVAVGAARYRRAKSRVVAR